MAAYWLGVDLGTTFTAAAISRADGSVEVLGLGTRAPTMPSVVLVRSDGEVLVGEAAERRAATEPTRVGREFKRRLGDPNPLFLGGSPYSAEALTAHLLRAVLDKAVEREGGPPARLVVTHPASWSPFKIDLLRDALRSAGVSDAVLMTEPEAAAIHYRASQRLAPGETVAVYDFGGGTFDAAVLAATVDGYELVGTPEGIERLGGVDFDQAVLAYVNAALGGAVAELDTADPESGEALAALRDSCRVAKEALSEDTDTTIAVHLPGRPSTQLRLTRHEFEGLIAPRVDETLDVLQRTIESAGASPESITRILAVGGSSRIPLVHQMVRDSMGRPLSFDSDPNLAIARGAAVLAHRSAAGPPSTPAPSAVAASAPPPQGLPTPTRTAPAPTLQPSHDGATSPNRSGRKPQRTVIAGAAAAFALVAGGAALALRGGDSAASPDTTVAMTTTLVASTTTEVATTNAPSTTTVVDIAGVTPLSADVPVVGERSAVFGGIRYTIEAITIGNGIDGTGRSALDDSAVQVGPTVVDFEMILENITDGVLLWDQTPFLRLEGDPVEIDGTLTAYDSTVFDGGAGGRSTYSFVLPEGTPVDTGELAGATLLLAEDDLLGDGIRVDGPERTAAPVAVTPVSATLAVGGFAEGTIEVRSVTPSLEAAGWLGSGYDEAGDYRAADGEIWLVIDVLLTCSGDVNGQCFFGLEQQVFRVEVDGLATGFTISDWGFDNYPTMTAGESTEETLYMRVAAGDEYALLLGEPGDEALVQRVQIPIADAVAALYEWVADYQL
jgi:actin-like ATPase involved in cell morphogenesis